MKLILISITALFFFACSQPNSRRKDVALEQKNIYIDNVQYILELRKLTEQIDLNELKHFRISTRGFGYQVYIIDKKKRLYFEKGISCDFETIDFIHKPTNGTMQKFTLEWRNDLADSLKIEYIVHSMDSIFDDLPDKDKATKKFQLNATDQKIKWSSVMNDSLQRQYICNLLVKFIKFKIGFLKKYNSLIVLTSLDGTYYYSFSDTCNITSLLDNSNIPIKLDSQLYFQPNENWFESFMKKESYFQMKKRIDKKNPHYLWHYNDTKQ